MNIKSGSRDNRPDNTPGRGQQETLFKRSSEYRKTLQTKVWPNDAARKALSRFYDAKRKDPTQLVSPKVDSPFSGTGHFSRSIPGLMHYHVTHDLRLIYLVRGNTVYLYGFYTHDDLGTGEPRNVNRQRSMASQFANMEFTESVDYASMLHRILILSGTKVSDT